VYDRIKKANTNFNIFIRLKLHEAADFYGSIFSKKIVC
jgi:hypothetical protein